jgi:hypothetical protein
MSRTIIQLKGVYWPPFWQSAYVLDSNGTMWTTSNFDASNWTALPAIQSNGATRTITNFDVSRCQSRADSIYASCTDGTLWVFSMSAPAAWLQLVPTTGFAYPASYSQISVNAWFNNDYVWVLDSSGAGWFLTYPSNVVIWSSVPPLPQT